MPIKGQETHRTPIRLDQKRNFLQSEQKIFSVDNNKNTKLTEEIKNIKVAREKDQET